jgi:hypothetical protein
MSETFHTPVSYWLELTPAELYEWALTAKRLSEEREKARG